MTLKKLEVCMLIIVLLVVLILCRRRKQNAEKCKDAYDCIIAIMILIAVFIVIHFLFCYQIGFPGSVTVFDKGIIINHNKNRANLH